MVHFAGDWVPAHKVWGWMEMVGAVKDVIARFNTEFPHLASDDTRDVVPLVHRRLKEIELRMPSRGRSADLTTVASELLGCMSPEQVIDTLAQEHGARVDMAELVCLAGEPAYAQALLREARELEQNQVSPEQTAELWNDFGRPAPGGGLWTGRKVRVALSAGS